LRRQLIFLTYCSPQELLVFSGVYKIYANRQIVSAPHNPPGNYCPYAKRLRDLLEYLGFHARYLKLELRAITFN
jgi:hypothetical protein